ncbi:MAG: ABC transporter ATP-binding protein, partial [Acidobacteria bacterium]|nr:ABC transporter ATP-binding protein [Acidobacteriota bacterium]
ADRLRALAGVARVETADGRLAVFWAGAPDTPALLRALVEGGAEVEGIAPRQATFEDAFLKLVRDTDGGTDTAQENAPCSTI